MTDLQNIIALAAKATPRPWQWWTSNSNRRWSADMHDGKVAYGCQYQGIGDIQISEANMAYADAAANSADVLAAKLLEIDKLCERYSDERYDVGYRAVAFDIRAILER